MQKVYMTTGDGLRMINPDGWRKSILLEQYPDDAWTWYSGKPTNDTELYDLVAYLYRAVQMDANAVSTMPMQLLDADGEVVDDTTNWQNVAQVLASPRRLLKGVQMSLFLFGRAYVLKETNRAGVVKSLRLLAPFSVEPRLDPVQGLVGFRRSYGTASIDYKPEQIIYFWPPDPRVEIGPPLAWPYRAATMAAGLLLAQDRFITEWMRRGGIPPTLLGTDGIMPEPERLRMETWWNKFIRGGFETVAKVFNMSNLKVQTIGQGVDSLDSLRITDDKRQDIAAAAGMPLSVLMSNAANYATAQTDKATWYDATIVPECEFIAETLTAQLFEPMGYKLEPNPDALDIYHVDEKDVAGAFDVYARYFDADIAAEIVGIELPARAAEEAQEEPEMEPEEPAPPAEPEPEMAEEPDDYEEPAPMRTLTPGAIRDLLTWQRLARKAAAKGKPQPEFTTAEIPGEIVVTITAALTGASTPEQVDAAFAAAGGFTETVTAPPAPEQNAEVIALLTAIKAAVEALSVIERAEEARDDGV